MTEEKKPIKSLTIRLKEETHRKLKEARWEYRMSMQEIIENAIKAYLMEKKEEKNFNETIKRD